MQKEGKLVRTRHFSIRACASPLAFPRVGLIVPRHGQSAVNRNRLKRRLREILRTTVLSASRGIDLIVRAAPRAYDLSFDAIRTEVGDATARLLKPDRA